MKKLLLFTTVICCLHSCKNEPAIPNILQDFKTVKHGNEIVRENSNFAVSSFKNILDEKPNENVFYSPTSVSLALGMVYNGAEGETKQAFENVFGYNFGKEDINNVNKNIIKQLTNTSKGTIFKVANSIWIDNKFKVKNNFVDLNKENYFAEVANVDFSSLKSKETINNWVSDNTNKKITKIINDGAKPKLLLVNALYFKGAWKNKFDKKKTIKRTFTNGNQSKEVDMMFMYEKTLYYENNIFSSIILPYKNDKFSMSVILPKENKSFDNVLEYLNKNNLKTFKEYHSAIKTKIYLPKFKFSYEQELKEVLSKMGLKVAFTEKANFKEISDASLLITSVLQKAFIEVNEEGSEAAAVTSVSIGVTSAEPGQPNVFKADRPFIFMITEKETNSMCFIGKISMPN